jgi:hypothetical protein
MDSRIFCKIGGEAYVIEVSKETDAHLFGEVENGCWNIIYDKAAFLVYTGTKRGDCREANLLGNGAMTNRRPCHHMPGGYQEVINRCREEIESGKFSEPPSEMMALRRDNPMLFIGGSAESDLRAALATVLDQVDYTQGACGLTESVGAVLPVEVIQQARRALDREPSYLVDDDAF